jgi:hypothetical protein
MFGIVEFLRRHTAFRVLFALLGIAVTFISVASLSGVKIRWADSFGIFSLVIVAPWLFWGATVSGPRFRLVFAPEKAQEKSLEAEKQFEVSNAPEHALKVDLARLNEYYVMNQSQVRSSFRCRASHRLVAAVILRTTSSTACFTSVEISVPSSNLRPSIP